MNRIEKALCELGKTKIPSRLQIIENDADDYIDLLLNGERIQNKNMQEAGNDFEGWAVAIYICTNNLKINRKIRLGVDPNKRFDYDGYVGKGHLGRFLFRAMRFSEQYSEWFELSDYLKDEVGKFEKYLKNGVFVNNIGDGPAGSKNKYDDENAVEEAMAAQGILRKTVKSIDIGDNPVYRQLPVGLFIGDVAKKNMVFTGGKSAIDLWTRNGNEVTVVELKTKNVMMGIVTEIFFYSNYMRDLLREDGLFQMSEPPKKVKDLRGYDELYDKRPNRVNGILLADNMRFHPWVKNGLVDILNKNQMNDLNYYLESYTYEVRIG